MSQATDGRPSVVDLFCGCGGIGLAFTQAGYGVSWSCDINEKARDTYEANLGHRPHGDIFDLPWDSLGGADVVAGGFPCQPYSKAGFMKGFDDPRANTFNGMLEVIRRVQPRVVLGENVSGLLQQAKGDAFRKIVESLYEAGYTHVQAKVLDATQFGGCQHRERLFIVASKDKPFDFGELAYRPAGKLADVLEPADSVPWMAPEEYTLIESPKVQASGLVFAGHRNKGMRYPDRDPRRSGNHYQQNRIYSSRGVFQTISSQEISGRHWVEHGGRARRLTRLEIQRLQGFPDDFRFAHKDSFYQQVGNSVFVPCVRAIAEGIRDQLLGGLPAANAS